MKSGRQNNFDQLAASYQQSAHKPDKRYSILPTVLSLVGDVRGATVADLGCGDGFFTRHLAQLDAVKVVGIDNSTEQLKRAVRLTNTKNIEYVVADIFRDALPSAHVICAPFVLNYVKNVSGLHKIFKKIHASLHNGGRLVAVVDLPSGKNLRQFGAQKIIEGKRRDGATIQINLYDGDLFICSLSATYFTRETITHKLESAGFSQVTWHKPSISPEGMMKFGRDFWKRYKDDPELGYVVAIK